MGLQIAWFRAIRRQCQILLHSSCLESKFLYIAHEKLYLSFASTFVVTPPAHPYLQFKSRVRGKALNWCSGSFRPEYSLGPIDSRGFNELSRRFQRAPAECGLAAAKLSSADNNDLLTSGVHHILISKRGRDSKAVVLGYCLAPEDMEFCVCSLVRDPALLTSPDESLWSPWLWLSFCSCATILLIVWEVRHPQAVVIFHTVLYMSSGLA